MTALEEYETLARQLFALADPDGVAMALREQMDMTWGRLAEAEKDAARALTAQLSVEWDKREARGDFKVGKLVRAEDSDCCLTVEVTARLVSVTPPSEDDYMFLYVFDNGTRVRSNGPIHLTVLDEKEKKPLA